MRLGAVMDHFFIISSSRSQGSRRRRRRWIPVWWWRDEKDKQLTPPSHRASFHLCSCLWFKFSLQVYLCIIFSFFFTLLQQVLDRIIPPAQEPPDSHRQSVAKNIDGPRLLSWWQVLGVGRVRPPTVRAHLGSRWAHTGGRVRWAQVRCRLRGESFFFSLVYCITQKPLLFYLVSLDASLSPRNVQKKAGRVQLD